MYLLQSCFCISRNQFLKNLCNGTQWGGFQFLLILDLWGIRFHVVVVFGLGKNLLFKYVLGHCDSLYRAKLRTLNFALKSFKAFLLLVMQVKKLATCWLFCISFGLLMNRD